MQTSQRTLSSREERNKAVVLEYYQKLCQQWDFDAARQFIGSSFVQHNPAIRDGIDGLREWVTKRPAFANALRADIRRVLVDGDFVVLHTLIRAPAELTIPDMVIADFFRLENHQVVEHWDVIQPVPGEVQNRNSMA